MPDPSIIINNKQSKSTIVQTDGYIDIIFRNPLVSTIFIRAVAASVEENAGRSIKEIVINIADDVTHIDYEKHRAHITLNVEKIKAIAEIIDKAMKKDVKNSTPTMTSELTQHLYEIFYGEIEKMIYPQKYQVDIVPVVQNPVLNYSSTISEIILTNHENKVLSPEYLHAVISPYLLAIESIQHIIDKINGQANTKVKILSITQNSPIGVSLEGVSETIQIILDNVMPLKRQNAKKMADFALREKRYEIEKKRMELQEINFRFTKNRKEIEKESLEIEGMRESVEKARLENERTRFELFQAKTSLVLDILAKVAPNLPEIEKLTYITMLLPDIDTTLSSDFDISLKK